MADGKNKELALVVGITPQYLSNLISGSRNASRKLALTLAKRTRTSPEIWIFGRKNERKAAVENYTMKTS